MGRAGAFVMLTRFHPLSPQDHPAAVKALVMTDPGVGLGFHSPLRTSQIQDATPRLVEALRVRPLVPVVSEAERRL